ncbi:MAG: LamG-like jellyroll fold domain-containing protein [Planctomycetota bacterium]|jgi:hypothetical protein
MTGSRIFSTLVLTLALGGLVGCGAESASSLRDAVLFHASFDTGLDADTAAGDGAVHTSISRQESRPGNHREDVRVEPGAGRYGGALRFGKKDRPYLYYDAYSNMGFARQNWQGAYAVWLSLDPDADLEPGYCDPFQATDKSALDESLFIEFSKDHTPRRFRMAACPPLEEWNTTDAKWEDLPLSDRPVVEIQDPPFGRGEWTHIAVTFENFNTGAANGVARLYINGALRGAVTGWTHSYRWDPANARLKIGLSYIGLMDDLVVFNRALSAGEVRRLYEATGGVKGL